VSFTDDYLEETAWIIHAISQSGIDSLANRLAEIRGGAGRVFFLGVGGSAATASHAVNDFRKICGIECYAPTDNVAELTARCNDDGWPTVFISWLKGCKLNDHDAIFIFSVGGGNAEKAISANLVEAIDFARIRGASILGVVGRDGGYTAKYADACVVIPTANQDTITPHTEEMHGVILHLLASHPVLKTGQTKWESTK